MNTKYIKEILLVLNSSDNLMGKYPIGNKELTLKVRQLESEGIIYYKAINRKWIILKKGDVFFNEVE